MALSNYRFNNYETNTNSDTSSEIAREKIVIFRFFYYKLKEKKTRKFSIFFLKHLKGDSIPQQHIKRAPTMAE